MQHYALPLVTVQYQVAPANGIGQSLSPGGASKRTPVATTIRYLRFRKRTGLAWNWPAEHDTTSAVMANGEAQAIELSLWARHVSTSLPPFQQASEQPQDFNPARQDVAKVQSGARPIKTLQLAQSPLHGRHNLDAQFDRVTASKC